ncbi:MAG: Y-family DNA polymerase [Magnetococcales bacterium]|nr:Y-family DNA polymerase [Magnetococcales bacterium]
MSENRVALVDCNNFYVSCERLFRPYLNNRPVIVLSNNDGCAVARSNEAKRLGIPMGAPYHQIKPLLSKQGVTVFSSNYALYGDISARVMHTLRERALNMEVYSIDEAFLDFTGFSHLSLTNHCRSIQQAVMQHTGIPVSIGIGQTKTLAKLANGIAKKSPRTGGLLDLSNPDYLNKALHTTQVGDVWGVGNRWSAKLKSHGIDTAMMLRDAELKWVTKRFNVVMARTVMELRGLPTIPLDSTPEPSQSITSSRSFGRKVTKLSDLCEATASHVARAAVKLRKQELLANAMMVFIETSRFLPAAEQYRNAGTFKLPESLNDTGTLTKHALIIIKSLYREGFKYSRAGVILMELTPLRHHQPSLFGDQDKRRRANRLMEAVDKLNQQMGSGTIHFGAEGLEKSWRMRQQMKSPSYTTHWQEIPLVHAI